MTKKWKCKATNHQKQKNKGEIMKLLTKEIKAKLPPIYTHSEKKPEEVPIAVKFFHPFSSWAWYATEACAYMKDDRELPLKEVNDWDEVEDVMFFGWVHGTDPELGYFSLKELSGVKVMGLPIERDMYFGNHTLAEVMKERI